MVKTDNLMSEVTYIDAIHAALGKALEDDDSVFLYGQDERPV